MFCLHPLPGTKSSQSALTPARHRECLAALYALLLYLDLGSPSGFPRMSIPLTYLSIPQTLAPCHRAQVFNQSGFPQTAFRARMAGPDSPSKMAYVNQKEHLWMHQHIRSEALRACLRATSLAARIDGADWHSPWQWACNHRACRAADKAGGQGGGVRSGTHRKPTVPMAR